ncbi:hypothetical protein GTA51_01495 [Desulfovibrio aerotolerans]|uniref:Uncharacterized protein n=1 Tax=Solidesulfovibrio aerotolerans TaxID=295255 RepID=A0A7C9MJ12_9BACT|nr:hypothetical protein [Solidesulfovibrio aerotolerans]MYL81813.1 hypothetical protein [Solidesulfovibrio aerotolerans]
MKSNYEAKVLEQAEFALDALIPGHQSIDRYIVKKLISKICYLRSKGIDYRTIHTALLKNSKFHVSYGSFISYVKQEILKNDEFSAFMPKQYVSERICER